MSYYRMLFGSELFCPAHLRMFAGGDTWATTDELVRPVQNHDTSVRRVENHDTDRDQRVALLSI